MKHARLNAAIPIGLFVTVGALSTNPGYAQAQEPQCTLKTLTGRYVFSLNGTLMPPAFGVTQPTWASAAGFHIFNGDGTGTSVVTFRLAGVTVSQDSASALTYTVNSDCTGSYTVSGGPSFDIFVAPDGDSLAEIATAPPGIGVSDISQRVSRK